MLALFEELDVVLWYEKHRQIALPLSFLFLTFY